MSQNPVSKKSAIYFVILIGFVSLFADMTYEGARSVTGPYLALFGATATTVAFLALFFAPLVFFGDFNGVLLGMIFWGIGMGAQESIMRAVVAGMAAPERRATAFGVFNASYGLFWFLGSIVLGKMYDVSLQVVVLFSVGVQVFAILLLEICRRNFNNKKNF